MIPIKITDKTIIDLHYEGICKLFQPNQIDNINEWLATYQVNFKQLIKAESQQLRKIKKAIQTKKTNKKNPDSTTLIHNKYKEFSTYTKDRYGAVNLIQNLNLTVCPYCNRSFIHNFKREDKVKRSSQIDHFFPKGSGKYPYLALSFYNLIPSCYSCNHAKGVKKINLSPYEIGSSDDVLTFGWKPKDAAFSYPKGNISI